MSILLEVLLFIVVLIVLILVHEVGHFIVAKLSGIRVDEFGIGFPPRALTLGKVGGTEYTLNWLPLGGFVRLYGEEGSETEKGSFSSKPAIIKILVLLAGIVMNLVFAWILFSIVLAIGNPQELGPTQIEQVKDAAIVVEVVRPGSPADRAGFIPGDKIVNETLATKQLVLNYDGAQPTAFTALIGLDASNTPMKFTVDRNGKTITIMATPTVNTIPGASSHPGLGIEIATIGTVKTPLLQAPYQGLLLTWNVVVQTAIALGVFFKSVVTLSANFAEVSGPIGIANAVGQASMNGISALLSLVAIISVNLALINLLPIPALDGGRVLFVIIETIIRRPLNSKIAERVNMVGFVLLILLMIVVSVHDVFILIK